MDVCAATGVELFILDGPTWAKGYGNWAPKAKRFPHGLGPLCEYAHQKACSSACMPKSKAAGATGPARRPFGNIRTGSPPSTAASTPAAASAFSISPSRRRPATWSPELTGLIERLKLDIYRHDQNMGGGRDGSATLRDGFLESDWWRHHEAFYAICDRIAPGIPIWSCSRPPGAARALN